MCIYVYTLYILYIIYMYIYHIYNIYAYISSEDEKGKFWNKNIFFLVRSGTVF